MRPVLLKFKNKELVIAEIAEHPDQNAIWVSRPVEIVLTATVTDEGTVESFSMRPWISLAAEMSFVVEKSEVLLTAVPADSTTSQYISFVERYYGWKQEERSDPFSMIDDIKKNRLLN